MGFFPPEGFYPFSGYQLRPPVYATDRRGRGMERSGAMSSGARQNEARQPGFRVRNLDGGGSVSLFNLDERLASDADGSVDERGHPEFDRCEVNRMFPIPLKLRLNPVVWLAGFLLFAIAAAGTATSAIVAIAQDGGQDAHESSMPGHGMAHMAGHMYLTTLRPVEPGDSEK